MSTGLLAGVALLGALAGLAAPRAARHFTAPLAPHVAGATPNAARDTRSTPRVVEAAPGAVRDTGAAPGAGWGAAAGAVVFTGLAAALGADPVLPVLLVLAAVGLVLALVDLSCLRLPDPLVGAAALVAAVGLTGAAAASGSPGRLLGAVAGAALCFACHVVLAVLPGSRLGFGDVKLAAVLGLPLGWLGGSSLALGLLLPHVLHGALVLVLLVAGRVRRDTPLPLGPALLTGAWLAALTA
ncbi:leader peptidase (prepilin peptidase)/N-methyltransferase [Micromonospora sp. M71_S20]|uniref:prepilin peptidase n=1 Tax=Micromonospora sp. M71_S20 TaxID=592872 RepID=UPI000F21A1FE|nr:prepilin peptidase [Micromonospora sp. M71_S20]RLK24546.1 leader peptidase (prepilin peptidase)/N-methyltransferase [Micromonospora sp. M71_S20]